MVWASDQDSLDVYLGGDPKADPGHAGEIISLGWLRNILEDWMEVTGERIVWTLISGCNETKHYFMVRCLTVIDWTMKLGNNIYVPMKSK